MTIWYPINVVEGIPKRGYYVVIRMNKIGRTGSTLCMEKRQVLKAVDAGELANA